MRFINNGPEVPDRLVQAHEDGKVVFFCGAGISYPAGLPGFEGLTRSVFEALGEEPDAAEKTALDEKRFDVAIDLLERRIRNRPMVREKIQTILTPKDLTDPSTTSTHKAILTLAKSKDKSLRLVTTNFDRLFVVADPSLTPYAAPLLPVPKKSRWNGLIHLHGLLPKDKDPTALNNLVVSSGDFGLAYLTERWASRFVTELFRHYVVCFVGYSLGDPVLRYMLDALAADRILGEASEDVFAFGSFSDGRENAERQDWQAKGVIPILYHAAGNHDLLHKTLQEWSAVYRDGLTGKTAIVVREAIVSPSPDTSDGQVDRVLWALMDPSGLSAKAFADLNPVPPVEWLDVFIKPRFYMADLRSLGVTQESSLDSGQTKTFSLLSRPAPLSHSTRMSLLTFSDPDFVAPRLDDVMWHLSRWLCRHLDQQKVLTWVINNSCALHPQFRELVTRELDANPPRISGPLAVIWRLICLGLGRSAQYHSAMSLYRWCDQFKRFGWSVPLKREFLQMLRPIVQFREPLRWDAIWQDSDEGQKGLSRETKASDYASWEICLGIGEQPWDKLREIKQHGEWHTLAIECLPGITTCLQDALELMAELGGASWQSDLSYIARPSIVDHPQNNTFRDWTALIQLCRDAWLTASTHAPSLAKAEFERWNLVKFPLFKRLVFHAATESPLVDHAQGLSVLLQDESWWLWSPETQRESLCLLTHLVSKLDLAQRSDLCKAILAGPPRAMFRKDLETDRWDELVDHTIWLRLKTWEKASAEMTDEAKLRLHDLATRYPQWELQSSDRDQFPFRMESGSGGFFRQRITLPRQVDQLADALQTRPLNNMFYEDDWEDICRTESDTAIAALHVLGKKQVWNAEVWRVALRMLAPTEVRLRSLEEIGPYLLHLPKDAYQDVQHSYVGWLKELAAHVPPDSQEMWFQLVDKIYEYAETKVDGSEKDRVQVAINNPVGQATEAIFDSWYRTEPVTGSQLPEPIQSRLTRLFKPEPKGYIHGRVITARHLRSLYSVDRPWTKEVLLPYLDWGSRPDEARGTWQGYLWTPRISAELLEAFKIPFLATAYHYSDLGQYASQYASLLTVAALELEEHFTKAELREAFNALPKEGLAESAAMLARALESAGEQRGEYWSNRVKPFISSVWPKSHDKRSSETSAALARICVHVGSFFQEAVTLLKPFLVKTKNLYWPLNQLAESKLATRYPLDVLSLLNVIVDEADPWPPQELKTCLDQISSADSKLISDPEFRGLQEYWARYR